jgi:hypothetical protein
VLEHVELVASATLALGIVDVESLITQHAREGSAWADGESSPPFDGYVPLASIVPIGRPAQGNNRKQMNASLRLGTGAASVPTDSCRCPECGP